MPKFTTSNDPGRSCARCGGRLRSYLYHLHELPVGSLVERPDQPGKTRRLNSIGPAVASLGEGEEVERDFETLDGKRVSFRTKGKPKFVAPGMQVRLVRRGDR